eukprot:376917-Lingulodinium_polyedra.AAC.1
MLNWGAAARCVAKGRCGRTGWPLACGAPRPNEDDEHGAASRALQRVTWAVHVLQRWCARRFGRT